MSAQDLNDAVRIARALARIAQSNDIPKPYSIGNLVAELDALEERIARGKDFDRGMGTRTLSGALRSYQQHDADGVFVIVSREAVEAAAQVIDRMNS